MYMFGGQIEKGVRRFGVPNMSILFLYLDDRKRSKREKLRYLFLLLMMGVLSLGYGESSWLRKLCGGKDRVTRLMYSLALALVFVLVKPVAWFFYIPILAIAFQIRAGELGSINLFGRKFDFLIEDIVRGMGIFVCLLITL